MKHETKEKMRCPVCGDNLVQGEVRKFETLSEHVGAPNAPVSEKQGYKCGNKECKAHKANLHWLWDGEGPYGTVNTEFWGKGKDLHPPNSWWGRNYP